MITPQKMRELAAGLGLRTPDPRTAQLSNLGEGALSGQYGFLIAARNLSEMSPESRDLVWRELAEHLAPDGVAFLPFDTYPGAHFRGLIRDLALSFQTLEDAFAYLELVAKTGVFPTYREFVQQELDRLRALEPAAAARELWNPPPAFTREEIERHAHQQGLLCAFPEAGIAETGWALIHRQPAVLPAEPPIDNSGYHHVDYPEYVHNKTHPDRIAAIAYVFGLNPMPVTACRVLELGCGSGLSLRAFAAALPGSEFLGVDFAQAAIDKGNASAQRNGLRNIRFEAMDLMDFGPGHGKFDYILVHGIYSWVPEPVRERVLEICRDHLSPRGIAYVSFNANPGFRLGSVIRELGLHGATSDQLLVRGRQAMDYLSSVKWDADAGPREKLASLWLDSILKTSVAQNSFDEFGAYNFSPDFAEFCAHMHRYGLRYLAESPIADWSARTLPSPAQDFLAKYAGDAERRIALQDGIRLTAFHSSLLCHESATPASAPVADRVMDLLVASYSRRKEDSAAYVSYGGVEITISNPLMQGFMSVLESEWPRRISIREAMGRALKLLPSPERASVEALLALWETGMVDFYCSTSPARTGGVYPLAGPLVREKAREGLNVPAVTGCTVELSSELDRELVLLLDGDHSFSDLRAHFHCTANELAGRIDRLARLELLIA